MADIASLNVLIGARIDDFEAKMATVQKGIGRVGDAAKEAGESLTKYLTLPLGLLAGAAIKTAADIDSLERGFAATYKGAKPLADALAEVKEAAKLPGLGLREAIQGATNLQAAGFSADQAKAALLAFGNALATVGKGKVELDRVTLALTQINNTPFVQGQDLNQLRQTLPQIGEVLQKAFGTTSAEGLRKLGVTSKEFIATVTAEFAKLPAVTGGLKNGLENLSDAATLALAKIGNSLNKSLNLEAVADKISAGITRLATAFSELDPSTQKLIIGLAGVAAAAGPILVVLGSIGAAIPAVTAGFSVLGITSVAALGPIGIAAAAVAAAAVLIYQNWERVGPLFAGIGNTLAGAAASIRSSFAPIGELFGAIGLNAGTLSAALKVVGATLTDYLVTPLRLVAGGLDIVIGNLRVYANLLSGDFKGATSGAKQVLDGLKLAFLGIPKPVQEAAASYQLLSPELESISLLSRAQNEILAASSARQAAANTTLTKSVGILEELRRKLKEVKEAREAETTATGIAADNKLIASLEKQIAALEGKKDAAQKVADQIAKAFAEIQAKVNGVDVRINLGQESQYDGLIQKIKELQQGIQTVTDKGVRGNDSRLLNLINQLSTAQAELKNLFDKFKPGEFALDFDDYVKTQVAQIQKELNAANLTARVEFEYDGDATKLADALSRNQQAAQQKLAVAGVPANAPATQGITGQVAPLKAAAFESNSLSEYSKGLERVSNMAQALGGSFDKAGATAAVFKQRLVELGQEGYEKNAAEIEDLRIKVAAYEKQSDEFQNKQAALKNNTVDLGASLVTLGEGLAQSFGQLAAGGLSLDNFGESLLRLVGQVVEQLGEAILATGIGMLALEASFANPFGAIAAGAALIAIGAGISSIASSPAGKGGSSSAVSSPAGATYSSNAGNSSSGVNKIELVVKLRGQDLVAVQRLAGYRELRTN